MPDSPSQPGPIARAQHASSQRALQLTRQILDEIVGRDNAAAVGVRFWDGSLWPDKEPRPTYLHLKHPGALRAIFLRALEIQSCEAFIFDDFDIIGRSENLLSFMEALRGSAPDSKGQLRVLGQLLRLPPTRESRGAERTAWRRKYALRRLGNKPLEGDQHSLERDREAIQRHYDVSNDFYRIWLDEQMVYSCAYYRTREDTLEQAQQQKLDLICRKLRLQPGQKFLDIGCGWGALIRHASKHYGVEATGVTISEAQAELARQRISEEGLEDHCQVLVRDYREIEGEFDAVASIGMCEHVGAANLAEYFGVAFKALRPGGVFLNHGIANRKLETKRLPTFIDRYVFPDGQLIPIPHLLQVADAAGFEVRDVENLREHYALTLSEWVRRLEDRRDEARRHVDEVTYRIWRLYLAASAFGFETRILALYQTLLSKPDASGRSHLPLTREDWFV